MRLCLQMGKGRKGTGEQSHTVSMETWEAGLGARGGWLSDFILGERWRCVVDANCYVTVREGRKRKGAENEFSKERNLTSAWRVRSA